MIPKNTLVGAALLSLLLGLGYSPSQARACSGLSPDSVFVDMAPGVYDVPLEGVVVLHASAGEEADATVSLVGADGVEVPGTSEEIVLSEGLNGGGYPSIRRDVLLVFRADEDLAPSTEYEVRVQTLDQTQTFAALSRSEPYDEVPQAVEAVMDYRRRPASVSLAYSCVGPSEADRGECPSCEYTDTVDAVIARATLEPGTLDPFTIRRLSTDETSHVIRGGVAWDGRERDGASISLRAGLESYCVWIEAESLVTGLVTIEDTVCFDSPELPSLPAPEPMPAPDPMANPPGDVEAASGCSVGAGTGASTPGPALGLLLVVGLLLRRRRT